VHGARPQIEDGCGLRGARLQYIAGLRVTDEAALACVKEAARGAGEVEALFSDGPRQLADGGRAAARRLRQLRHGPAVGVRDGVDYQHTGEVRRVDAEAIRERLGPARSCSFPPLGYSPTGEVFNLHRREVAGAVATAIGADQADRARRRQRG